MHELSITQHILDITIRHAEAANAVKITDIYLVVGQLSSIVDDSVQFYWDMICKGTIAEGAALHFKRLPAELQCSDCHHHYAIEESTAFECPRCGSRAVQFISGEQFFIEAIDIKENA